MATPIKKVAPKKAAKKLKPKVETPDGTYFYALGRRKRATAKTKIWLTGTGKITVNGKPYTEYFPTYEARETVTDALKAVGHGDDVTVVIECLGGGLRGQAEAAR